MKSFPKISIAMTLLYSAVAFAQLPNSVIKHVIVLIQENRTPDNLFGGDIAGLPNANLATSGACYSNQVNLYPWPLDACFDPYHSHDGAWTSMWDNGNYDGACDITITNAACVPHSYPITPNYTYAENTLYDGVHGLLGPYYQIASTYGYANYMFQTNQGPSFEAHQFLFSGTSAPDFYNDPAGQNCYYESDDHHCWEWFAAELPPTSLAGCTDTTTYVEDIDPDGNEAYAYQGGYPCYNHNTLATLLDGANKQWRYYTPSQPYGYWTAPNAITAICGTVVNGQCTGADWQQDVIVANSGNYAGDYAPILTDIGNCALQPVSWVVPDGVWSDHPGNTNTAIPNDGGPSWVSAIVNAVGGATSCDNNAGYWSDTVILITWDDWGGWFDHVSPAKSAGGPSQPGYPNGTGASYVYGARVPLLVVSGYAKQGYISGPKSGPNCGTGVNYCHDFGSILGFTEHVFGLGQISNGGTEYPYADYLAPDSPNGLCGLACSYPLADFFTSTFTPFTTQIGPTKYAPQCFHTPNIEGCWPGFTPQPPDTDGDND
jgi:Phosphoesterase family